jgi:Tfp pilus assembly protein PilO
MTKALAPFIFIALSIGLFFSYIRPAYEVLGAVLDQETRVNQALEKAKLLESKTGELTARLGDIERDDVQMKRLKTLLPDTVDPVRLVIDIDALARKHGVTVTSFDLPQRDQQQYADSAETSMLDARPVGEATMRVVAHGGYSNLKAFTQSLEKSLTLVDIAQLSFSKFDLIAQEGAPVGGLQASFVIKTHWLK